MKLFINYQNAAKYDKGFKSIYFNGKFVAIGDKEDLPPKMKPWYEITERGLETLAETGKLARTHDGPK